MSSRIAIAALPEYAHQATDRTMGGCIHACTLREPSDQQRGPGWCRPPGPHVAPSFISSPNKSITFSVRADSVNSVNLSAVFSTSCITS